jgi:drug/metabolite transporter (DMT)-like permease
MMLLIITSVLWSLSGVFVKKVDIHPVVFAFWRSLAAGLTVAPLIGLGRRVWPNRRLMGLSVVLYTCVVTLLITAMTRGTAATGILLQYTGPAFCALLAWLLLGRKIRPRTWLAVIVALLGVGIMIVGGEHSQGWVGPVCGLLSGVAFGGLVLVLERLDPPGGQRVNPFAIVAMNNLGCAAVLIPVVGMMEGSIRVEPWQIGMVCLCGAIQLGIPYVLFQLGLRRVSAVDASLLILLEPVLNPVWVWLVIGERPDLATFVGGAAILLAMGLEATAADVR